LAVRKVFRTGNSVVVSLPQEALESLGVRAGENVSLEVDKERRQVVIRPLANRVASVDAEFARQVAEFIEQYRPALEALARE